MHFVTTLQKATLAQIYYAHCLPTECEREKYWNRAKEIIDGKWKTL